MEDLEGLNFNISISGNANQTQSTESSNNSTVDDTWGGWVTDEKPKGKLTILSQLFTDD